MLLVTSRTVGSAVALAAASALSVTALSALAAAPVAAAPVAAGTASAASAATSAPPPVRDEDRPGRFGDRLIVTVRHAGPGRDGTYELFCHPAAGTHPNVRGACAAVDRNTHWGSEPFAPVPEGSVCTMLYGGPATAHVTGTWAGRPVDARFDRGDGCEIARWDRMVPLLPNLGS
ncbi:SSI family serine proteinase inhibitor [Streptomyces shenzhenensis]|uniref:SSI family serine proteinase inhibitor n=1 Tax=Streptomyces shenzhenensis TaxID=943815 RepID=UPI0036911686